MSSSVSRRVLFSLARGTRCTARLPPQGFSLYGLVSPCRPSAAVVVAPPPSTSVHRSFSTSGNGLPTGFEHVAEDQQRMKQEMQFQQQQQAHAQAQEQEDAAETIQVLVDPPEKLTPSMLQVINDCVDLYVQMGVSYQRLVTLSKQEKLTVVEKWQKMMEIYFTTQLQVISNLGYSPDEQGLQLYALHTKQFFDNLKDRAMEIHFKNARQIIWRKVVSTAFGFSVKDIPELTIVEARNHMHLVTSKMVSPDILMMIQRVVGRITNPEDVQQENIMKHNALQQILVNDVYLGSKILPQMGFESGAKGYAMFQCSVSDYEGDPLMQQYQTAAMKKVWDAAGLNIHEITGEGMSSAPSP
ncbi:hypothetical protein ACA910_007955 [Epithemia clementina (nom. ined.)]